MAPPVKESTSQASLPSAWTAPNQLSVANLQILLSKHDVPYNKSKDKKEALLMYYSHLVHVKAPEDILLWPSSAKLLCKLLPLQEKQSDPQLGDNSSGPQGTQSTDVPADLDDDQVLVAPNDHLGKHAQSDSSSEGRTHRPPPKRKTPPRKVPPRKHQTRARTSRTPRNPVSRKPNTDKPSYPRVLVPSSRPSSLPKSNDHAPSPAISSRPALNTQPQSPPFAPPLVFYQCHPSP
ncbi:hypothetical protein PCASD_12197 [Puccinia coronata f. sp. avenae]|uniref:Uncharacterized protein n=1 Tax=Puccinia coronata f. sp. avenae TaxID=200324 RepID=A0A2N5UIT9_9BASI|nr:hypothetical protein PCASD_12197 [Puccinia coronata f. sp. avenae]